MSNRYPRPRKVRHAGMAIALATLAASSTNAGETTVTKSGSFAPDGTIDRPYSVIHAGVCESVAGHDVHLGAGTYAETMLLNKPLRLDTLDGVARVGDMGSSSTTLQVVAYNTHLFGDAVPDLGPPFPAIPLNLTWQDANRAVRIGETLATEDVDVCGLQEVWDPVKYQLITSNAAYAHSFYGGNVDPLVWDPPGPALPVGVPGVLNSGLGLLSKHALSGAVQVSYRDETEFFETMASKGHLAATVTKDGFSIGIFNTHLQAHNNSEQVLARDQQLAQLGEAVAEYRLDNPANPVIVMGDFNVIGEDFQYLGAMERHMGNAGLRDIARNISCFDPGPDTHTSAADNPLKQLFSRCSEPGFSLCRDSCLAGGGVCEDVCDFSSGACALACEAARTTCDIGCDAVCVVPSDTCDDCRNACDNAYNDCIDVCALDCNECTSNCGPKCEEEFCSPVSAADDSRLDYVLYAPSSDGSADLVPTRFELRRYRKGPPLSEGGLTTDHLSDHYGLFAEFRVTR